MDRFLIQAAFRSETLIRERRRRLFVEPTFVTRNVVRLRILGVVSKNQNKLLKCCI